MEIIFGIVRESWTLLVRMAPYLLLGFGAAGVLHAFVDTAKITRHLGERSFTAVIKASLVGIPLPLCSCGVLPLAMSLKKEGASKGAVISFLISTPTTGVDSILATYSLLGWFFAAYRVLASFFTGVLAGVLANVFLGDEAVGVLEPPKCKMCGSGIGGEKHSHSLLPKLKAAFEYAFVELIRDTGKWLIIGVLAGGAIAYFIPESFISTYMGSGLRSMLIMLAVGIPMYVCASASIPIAAVLMMKGLSPGAAFVFLLAGPATNAAGMALIGGQLGKKALAVYLFSITLCSLGFGYIMDLIGSVTGITFFSYHEHASGGGVFQTGFVSAVILILLISNTLFRCSEASK
ncbi:MAG: SO_0444 family Cu/Zn efflux transporter [Candidatus Omnitrophica bacterium]|nr:SO_0444 family Cu/Zn efflux transporter [Candidatus Omnitrophota bacterium]